MMKNRLTLVLAAGATLLLVLLAPSAVGAGAAAVEGTLTEASFQSATLNEAISYNVYLPAGYEGSTDSYPVLYLLHGRGDSKSAWTQMKGALDALIASGEIQPTIAIMPDAPWSSRASYYVDSGYTGADPGRKVETAFTKDLIAHVDATYRTVASRTGRGIAGYSMGGYGALRYSLAHPDLFGAAIVLSPAVYVPSPPSDSSTREFGAFGLGKSLFVDSIYKKLNYPALFPSFSADRPAAADVHRGRRRRVQEPGPEGRDPRPRLRGPRPLQPGSPRPQPDRRAARRRRRSRLGRLGADVRRGRQVHLPVPQPDARDPDEGHADRHRPGGARGRRRDRRWRATSIRRSRPGAPIAGQPYAGDKDLVLVKDSPAGTRLWTRELGTTRLERAYGVAIDPAGNAVVTGYTNGDLDGAHAGNTTDDVFVAKFDPNGNLTWLRQFGVAAVADRGYALATDAAGNVYVTGYTRGNLGATNVGDKDVYIAKLDPSGAQLWLQQFGSAGEDKAWGVAATSDGIRVGGMTSGALGTPAGALDGWVARYDAAGNRAWLQQFGTAANEEVWGLTADAAGNTYVAAYSAGDFDGPLAGDKDLVAARFDAAGTLTWKDQLGTDLNDKSAAVALDGAGNLYVAGFSDGDLEGSVGKFDSVLVKYAPDTSREWVRQFLAGRRRHRLEVRPPGAEGGDERSCLGPAARDPGLDDDEVGTKRGGGGNRLRLPRVPRRVARDHDETASVVLGQHRGQIAGRPSKLDRDGVREDVGRPVLGFARQRCSLRG